MRDYVETRQNFENAFCEELSFTFWLSWKDLLKNFLAKISLFLKAEYKIEGVFEKV